MCFLSVCLSVCPACCLRAVRAVRVLRVRQSKMMKVTLDRFRNRVVNSVPMKRIGADEDMAAAAIFLASRASDYITGVVIPVDGGILVNAKL